MANSSSRYSVLTAAHWGPMLVETDGEIVFTQKKGEPVPEVGTFVNVRLTQADAYDLMGVME